MTTLKPSWIRYPKPNPQATLRLFCLPYAGSGAAIFHPWVKLLPSEIELGLILLPGRETRFQEAALTDMAALVQPMAEALAPELAKPFALFGHSMGALVAFVLTHQLRHRYNLTPRHLFMSARNAPQWPDLRPPLHALPPAEFLSAIQERYDGIPKVVWENQDLLDLFLPILRADLTLFELYRYTPAPPLTSPLTVLGSPQDRNTSAEGLAAWQEQTQGVFQLHWVEGSHFFLNERPQDLLRIITNSLTRL